MELNSQTLDALSTLKTKRSEEFNKILEETYRKANGQFVSDVPDTSDKKTPTSTIKFDPLDPRFKGYDPSRSLKEPVYRFRWRKKFIQLNVELPPELEAQPRGRPQTGTDLAERLKRFKKRRELEAAGLPVPKELQRRRPIKKRP